MRLFNVLTATRRPAPGTAVRSQEELVEALFALNREASPFRIIDGHPEMVDLIAEWKIADAEWQEVFARAGVSKVFRIHMKLDDEKHRVRSVDREYGVAWTAGVPRLSAAASSFWGQKHAIELGRVYAFTETLTPGCVYDYRFDTREIKRPIQDAVTACGWTYRGVAMGRL